MKLPNLDESVQIKNNNRKVIDYYFFENYDYLKKVVLRYCKSHYCISEFEDYLQNLYVVFPKLKFLSSKDFYFSIFNQCKLYYYGGIKRYRHLYYYKVEKEVCMLDNIMSNKEEYRTVSLYSDFLAIKTDLSDILYNPNDCYEELYSFICSLLTKKQLRFFDVYSNVDFNCAKTARILAIPEKTAYSISRYMRKRLNRKINLLINFLDSKNCEFTIQNKNKNKER